MKTFDLEYKILHLDHLHRNPKNPNVMSPTQFAMLVKNIERYGFQDPIIVRPLESGEWMIVDGEHRAKALEKLGYTEVPCVITELEDLDGAVSTLMLNKIKGRLAS